jgi:uncharacterized protein YkwD
MLFTLCRAADQVGPSISARPSRGLARKAAALFGAAVSVAAVIAAGGTAHASTVAESTAAKSVLSLLNSERAAHYLPALGWSPALVNSAHAHNVRMASSNLLSHQLSGEASLGDRISAAGVPWHFAAENIGWTTNLAISGATGMQTAMYNEAPPNDGHRLNILSGSVHYVGIDILIGPDGKQWLTADFADAGGSTCSDPVCATSASVASSRGGQAVYINGLLKLSGPTTGLMVRPSGRAVYLQRYLNGGWQNMLLRTTDAYGRLAVGFIQTRVFQYRIVVPATSNASRAASASTFR